GDQRKGVFVVVAESQGLRTLCEKYADQGSPAHDRHGDLALRRRQAGIGNLGRLGPIHADAARPVPDRNAVAVVGGHVPYSDRCTFAGSDADDAIPDLDLRPDAGCRVAEGSVRVEATPLLVQDHAYWVHDAAMQ